MLPAKAHIDTHQLAWIITDCFGDEEIITMADQCGLLHDTQHRTETRKDWIAYDLAACFFSGASIEDIVSQHLAKKAAQAARRVQFMDLTEIRLFLRSAEQLRAEGELGEILWALLVDSREDVQKHGHRLLADHEQSVPPSPPPPEDRNDPPPSDTAQKTAQSESDTTDQSTSPHCSHAGAPIPESTESSSPVDDPEYLKITPIPETDLNPKQQAILSNELKQNQQQINKLYSALSELKNGYTVLQSENDRLKQKIATLVEENNFLQDREELYRESELRIDQLNRENIGLKRDVEKFSNQLCEFHELQAQKEKITVELKSVEEMAYHSQQVLEQIQSNFYSQFSYLQGVNEEYKTVITRARQKIVSLSGQRGTAGTNRMLAGQPRVGVFVDVQNMFYAAKDRYARRLDYIKLLDLIVGPRNLVAAYAYVVQIPEINQAGFLSLLEHNGYTIKSKDLRMRGDGSAKGDWDVGIAIDIVSMLDALDIVILASGDGDFCALAELIKQHGKRIEVAAFEHNTSMDLQRIADQFFPIGDEMLI
ncbi:NYN domain-containing protein [Candidatus Poribacteria bacterium]|nr:NYN domain-containing protein [Candidatus Poribacteria bacterium]